MLAIHRRGGVALGCATPASAELVLSFYTGINRSPSFDGEFLTSSTAPGRNRAGELGRTNRTRCRPISAGV
ncbi:MAG: hypothetical protein M5U35_01380 [Roseovarius sp.]|nr:hypothetical protein [Roseovarius sp.]